MPSFSDLRRLVAQLEESGATMTQIVEEMKTEGGHLTNFGDEFVMLCRKHGIQQAKVAKALSVTPTSVNRRYTRELSRNDFFNPPAEG